MKIIKPVAQVAYANAPPLTLNLFFKLKRQALGGVPSVTFLVSQKVGE